jgi:hypothetical protein
MTTIADEVMELRTLPLADLLARYEAVFGNATRVKHREFLWKRIAWKLQGQRLGGLSAVAKDRLESLISEIDIPLDERSRSITGRLRVSANKPVRATLTKVWRGTLYTAVPMAGGFDVNGVLYRSLSAAAFGITGTRWNGNLFWGVTKARKAQ